LEVVNLADGGQEELLQDFVSIIYHFSARLYGKPQAKRQTEKITQALEADDALSKETA
jgi:predicted site-specific integrase-resolvase